MKKFLSLVLALVMTMSLVTISAGATEFKDLTDVDSIEHKEAVELFNKIGIITGYEDGSFGPEKTITREQAAKIIAIMALGNDAASKLGAEKAPFPDVPATSQFAGYIGYCVSAGIIDGYKDGTFKPKGTLTGYQFAKMLLGVIGYGVNDEYVGTNWALNVARDGATIGLFEDATVTAGLIDRDNATQIAFNALNSSLVAWSDLLGAYTAYSFNMGNQTLLGTLAQNIFGLTTATKADGYGYNTHAWRQNGKVITGYYMTDKIIGTETDSSLTGNQLFNAYSWDVNNDGTYPTVPVYVNGTLEGNWNPSTALKSVAIKYIGKGYTVNFVDVKENIGGNMVFDGNVEKIVVTIPYLAEVTAVKAATSSADRSVTLKVYAEKSGEAASWTINNVETEEFAKGDMILVTPSSNTSAGFQEPLDMVKAETVEGKVTAFYKNDATNNNGSVTVDGVKYNYNFIFASSKNLALGDDLGQDGYSLNKATYTFYLDNVGNVIGVKVKDDAVNDYAYIIDKGTDVFDQAVKVLLSNGTIGTYIVSSKSGDNAKGAKIEKGEIFSYSINSNGQIVLDTLTGSYAQQLNALATTTNEDVNTANAVSGNNTVAQGSIVNFTKGYSVINMSGSKVVYADDSTVFVYYEDDGTVNVYTGKSNAPSISNMAASVVTKTSSTGTKYATYVVVHGEPANSLTDNYVYVLDNTYFGYSQNAEGDNVYFYNVIKDGVKTAIACEESTLRIGVYQYGMNDKFAGDSANEIEAGQYTCAQATINNDKGPVATGIKINVSSNDNVIVDPTNGYQYVIGTETKITDIRDRNNIVEGASIEAGQVVTVVFSEVSGLRVAKAIYITGDAEYTVANPTVDGAANSNITATVNANTVSAKESLTVTVTCAAGATATKLAVTATDSNGALVVTPAEKTIDAGEGTYTFIVTAGTADITAITVTATVG